MRASVGLNRDTQSGVPERIGRRAAPDPISNVLVSLGDIALKEYMIASHA
jgi:hypothetical protein